MLQLKNIGHYAALDAKCQLKKDHNKMRITLHQTHHQIADFNEIFTYLKSNISLLKNGIHVFPELFLTGYPLQDLCLQKPFIDTYHNFIKELTNWLKNNIDPQNSCLLLGGIDYDLSANGVPISLKNIVFQYGDQSQELQPIYTKRLLPNYDIFDEKKYFTKGKDPLVQNIFNKKFGILICEDMWSSSFYDLDPVDELYSFINHQYKLDAIINLSASPFILGKDQKRIKRAKSISHQFECPFFYVNRVGAEDEILFDGHSFMVNGEEEIIEAKQFQADCLEIELPESSLKYKPENKKDKSLTWEELFNADLDLHQKPARLNPWNKAECQDIVEALCFGFQEYATKNGFRKFTIALSGGIDSALVLTLIKLSLKPDQELEALYMPSIHSSPLSFELSLQLCQKLNIPLRSLPIKFLHSATKNLFAQTFSEPFEGLTDENIQSRLRGTLLYTRTNQINSMAVNTSNKSELAVGYSTQYGDSVGALSLLGDLYKCQVYRLANYINDQYNNIIPAEIIKREPTAELRENQIDTQSLPPYERLDAILEGILNYRYSKNDLIELGFEEEEIDKVFNLYKRNEYKRYQFCPIIKISSKSFGFGYRIPITKKTGFYNE